KVGYSSLRCATKSLRQMNRRYSMNPSICSGILRAVAYAADKHGGQKRKGDAGVPYITHPIAVANLLATDLGIEDLAVLQAALLHDVVEDTGTSAEALAAEFGQEVVGIVLEVTDDKTLDKEVRKQLQVDNAPHK